jgi:hypothetical protein
MSEKMCDISNQIENQAEVDLCDVANQISTILFDFVEKRMSEKDVEIFSAMVYCFGDSNVLLSSDVDDGMQEEICKYAGNLIAELQELDYKDRHIDKLRLMLQRVIE